MFEFWRQTLKMLSFRRVWWGVGGSPRTSGRFRHQCREKIFRPPLGTLENGGESREGSIRGQTKTKGPGDF